MVFDEFWPAEVGTEIVRRKLIDFLTEAFGGQEHLISGSRPFKCLYKVLNERYGMSRTRDEQVLVLKEASETAMVMSCFLHEESF